MEFNVFTNDSSETPYKLAPGETLLLSSFGQLLVVNLNDDSITPIKKQGKYIIVFNTDDDQETVTTVSVVY